MTYIRPGVPPAEQWPHPDGPDCPACDRHTHVRWGGPATVHDDQPITVNLWRCGACGAEFLTEVTHWPVLDGPDCPVCDTDVTCWAAIDPDHLGDLWVCEDGHEFTLTPEGIVLTPENHDLTEWAPIWLRDTNHPHEGDAA